MNYSSKGHPYTQLQNGVKLVPRVRPVKSLEGTLLHSWLLTI